ncbi:MAG: fumarate hydratase [Firmicutes bacterium]|nr:fumarate hydratase [Bacillota bacterium]
MKSDERAFEYAAAEIAAMIERAQYSVDQGVTAAITRHAEESGSPAVRFACSCIAANNEAAARTRCPACQDTGLAVIFADVGKDARIDFDLTAAVNEGVRRAYSGLRKSVADPLTRLNTGTNLPAVIHYDLTEGADITVRFLAKGAGSENMSRLYMLTPADEKEGIVHAVLDCVRRAGANPCPPVIVGVGVGGDTEKACLIAKRALCRGFDEGAADPEIASLEREILERVNALGIGVQGLGGSLTALKVSVETFPTHIAMLPVAVNIQCHSSRHGKIILTNESIKEQA